MCGFNDTATSEKKVISSPNWPYLYNNWENCEWFITTDVNSKIEIVFEQFELESGFDFLVCSRNFKGIQGVTQFYFQKIPLHQQNFLVFLFCFCFFSNLLW